MKGQCPICKGLFDAQPEWIGQQAQCPHCQAKIIIHSFQSVSEDKITAQFRERLLTCFLIILGVLNFLSEVLVLFCRYLILGFHNTFFCKLWFEYHLCSVIPITGCVVSFFYFLTGVTKNRKIHWEYLGIVLSFYEIIKQLLNVILSKLVYNA